MKLADAMKLRALQADGAAGEWIEYYGNVQPAPTFHPPSLKNPKRVPIDSPLDGWHRNDPPELKRRAKEDLAEILKRVRRQSGKPEVTKGAAYPIFPAIDRWT